MKWFYKLIFVFNIFCQLGYAQNSYDYYINQAQNAFDRQQFELAVQIMEDGLAELPKSSELKTKFVELLIKIAEQYHTNNRDDMAKVYIHRAQVLQPDHDGVKEWADKVSGKKQEPKQQEVIKETKPVQPRTVTVVREAVIDKQTVREIENSVNSLTQTRQELTKLYDSAPEIVKQLQKEMNWQRLWLLFITFGAILFSLGCLYFYFRAIRRFSLNEKELLRDKQRLVDLLENQQLSFAQNLSKLLLTQTASGEKVSTKDMLDHPNAHIRAHGVEMLEKELNVQGDPMVAAKLLLPHLRDPNNRVKANAAKAIYKYNSSVAISALEEMFRSKDRWQQSSAAWALGEIGDVESAVLLLKYIDILEPHSRYRATKSLEIILKNHETQIPSTIQEKIRQVMKLYATDIPISESSNINEKLENGKMLYNDKKHDQAIFEFKEIYGIDNNNVEALEYLGYCYQCKGNNKDALYYFEKVLEVAPGHEKIQKLITELKKPVV